MLVLLLPVAALGIVLGVIFRPKSVLSPEERFRQAMAALEARDLKSVARTIKVLRREPGFETHVNLLLGASLLQTGSAEAALKRLSARRPEGELRAPVLLLVAEAFYGLGRLTETELIARQLEHEQPDNVDAHRWLAAVYYDLGALNSAIKELGVVITLDPQDYQPRHLLGLIYFDSDNYADATKHYYKALELGPPPVKRREIIDDLAKVLVKLRAYRDALELLEQASLDAMLLALKSQCHWALGEHDLAIQILKQAEELDPDERQVLLLKGSIETEADNAEAAISPFTRHLKRDPHDFECRYRLALAYRSLGRIDRYETEIARMQESKELREQLTELGQQAADQPRNAEIRDRIADICEKLGKHELAETYRTAADSCRRIEDFTEPSP